MHRDQYGLIVQADGDGGDTAQREGMVAFVYSLIGSEFTAAWEFRQALQLEISPGVCVRHPFQPDFRSDPKQFSRDQQDPLIVAAGACSQTPFIKRMLWAQVKRLGKYQNADYLTPQSIGCYIRALSAWYLWPLLLFTDLGLLFQALHIYFACRNDPNNSDDNNHVIRTLQAQYTLPTPVSYVARKLYKALRPTNYGNTVLGEKSHIQGALNWYHSAQFGGNPEIAELYRPLVEKF